MAEDLGPLECWAIVEDIRDADGHELRRIHGVYLDSRHAITDSAVFQPVRFVEVVPFLVHRSPQWSNDREPALEQTDADFDVALDLDETPAS